MSRQGWLPLALLVAAAPARAHDADVLYVALDERGSPPKITEHVTLTVPSLLRLAPIDRDQDEQVSADELVAGAGALRLGVWAQMPLSAAGVDCRRDQEQAIPRDGYVELVARFDCGPGELRQDFRVLDVLPPNYRVVLGRQADGERGRQFAQGRLTALSIPRPAPQAWLRAPLVRDGLALTPAWLLRLDVLGVWLAVSGRAGHRWRGTLVAALALAVCAPLRVGVSWAALPGVVFAAVLPGRFDLLAGALAGAALGLTVGEPLPSVALGLGLGAAAAWLVASAVLEPVGRLMERRRRSAWLAGVAVVLVVAGVALG